MDSEDGLENLETRVKRKSCDQKRAEIGGKIHNFPKRKNIRRFVNANSAFGSGLRHMTFPTCIPVMAWPSVTLAALSQPPHSPV